MALSEAARIRKSEREKQKYQDPVYRAKRQAQIRAWMLANPDKVKATHKRWRAANPEKNRDNARRAARKSLGIPSATRPEPAACECCGGAPKRFKHLVLDHDHTTGMFRGWLCNDCNLAIGRLGDTRDSVLAALRYLERSVQ